MEMPSQKTKQIILVIITAVILIVAFAVIRAERLKNASPVEAAMTGSLLTTAENFGGQQYLIPHTQVIDSGLKAADVPALTNPKFTSVTAMDSLLADNLFGIDVEVGGQHRFYPYQILNWHRVVNDTFGDKELIITFDPLTGAAIVYVNPSEGETLSMAFAGTVYNNGELLLDNAGSQWLQINGTQVIHKNSISRYELGAKLTQYPAQSMKWTDWKNIFPGGEVLSSETGYTRDYTRHPYGQYEASLSIYFPVNKTDSRIGSSKWWVDGLSINGEHLALVKTIMQGPYVYNTVLGGVPISAFYDSELDMTHVFNPVVGDKTLTFTAPRDQALKNPQTFIDDQTKSIWSATGVATEGELKGTVLQMINAPEYYWFAWAATYPDTRVAVIDEQKAKDDADKAAAAVAAPAPETSTTPDATE
ncbi:TPA: hypothetical protein DEP96_02830 [Candidatus Uhrbacteria bacterium]|nr:hypothetical protein [Candidatus Uhrbacteria bacterium]